MDKTDREVDGRVKGMYVKRSKLPRNAQTAWNETDNRNKKAKRKTERYDRARVM
jgi:hypothetical protein